MTQDDLRTMEQDDLRARVLSDARRGDVDAIASAAGQLSDERSRERIERAIVLGIAAVAEPANGGSDGDGQALRSLSGLCVQLRAMGATCLLAELGQRDLSGRMPAALDGAMGAVYSAIASLRPEILGHNSWVRVIQKRPELARLAAEAIVSYEGVSGLADVAMIAIPEMGKKDADHIADRIASRFSQADLKALTKRMPKETRKRLRALLRGHGDHRTDDDSDEAGESDDHAA